MNIGGQDFNLTFDTGSADTWVFSNLMPTDQSDGHTLYDPSVSGSLMSGFSWGISYGDSSAASGVVYKDTVVIAGATATRQAVEAATSASSAFLSDTQGSGIMGMAFGNINTVRPTQQSTFFDTIKSSLATPLFAVTLKKNASGSFDFGYIDKTKYTGALTYMPATTSGGYWLLPMGAYKIGQGAVVKYWFDKIVDTGTSLLLLPQDIVTAYYAKVPGAAYDASWAGYTFPCTAAGFKLPNFGLRLNNAMHTVPGAYMNWAQINGTHCYGGMQPSTGLPFAILGDVFLKAVYTVFDLSKATPRIGFATQANMS